MSESVKVFVPAYLVEVQSQNTTQYAHWTAYRKYRIKWHTALKIYLYQRPEPQDRKMLVRIISLRGRLLDEGNLIGGCKPIPDILQRMNYLKDDNPKWVKVYYDQKQVPKEDRGTQIMIEEF